MAEPIVALNQQGTEKPVRVDREGRLLTVDVPSFGPVTHFRINATADTLITLTTGNALRVSHLGTSFTGTIDYQSSLDGNNWFNTPYVSVASTTATPSVGQFSNPSSITEILLLPPIHEVRIRALAVTAGFLDIWYREVRVEGLPFLTPAGAIDTELAAAGQVGDAGTASPTIPAIIAYPVVMNSTTVDRQRAVVAGLDSVGTGIAAAGLVGQLDDTSPSGVTENQFAPIRISSRRALQVEQLGSSLDDAAWTVAANPVLAQGCLADDTSPDSVDEGDIGAPAMTLAREQYVTSKARGAGGIISVVQRTAATSAARQTLVTPTSGKKIQIVKVGVFSQGLTTDPAGVHFYFGTGASWITNTANFIDTLWPHSNTSTSGKDGSNQSVYPDGAGPVGAADAVLSWITSAETEGDSSGFLHVWVHYREV